MVLCNFSKSFDGQSVTVHSKILAVYESELLKFGNECQMLWCIGRRLMQAADPIHAARFLRVAGQRPRHRRATEQRDELPPPHHSITSSARASNVGGTSRPSALRGLQVDDELELGRLQDRQIGGICALEDVTGIDADLTTTVGKLVP